MNGSISNVSNQSAKMRQFFTTPEIVIGSTLMVALMLLASLGNSITCVDFCRKPQLRPPTNVSIVILAVTDVLSAVFVMSFSLPFFISGRWTLSPTACTFNAYLILALLGMTFISMTFTAVIRYFCVVRASLHHHLKLKRTLYLISTLCLMDLLLIAVPSLVEFPVGRYSVRRSFCRLAYKSKKIKGTVDFLCMHLEVCFPLSCSPPITKSSGLFLIITMRWHRTYNMECRPKPKPK